MGIKGLWNEVKPICRSSHLSNFRGQRVAVDMYVWLHRGMIGSVDLNTESDVEKLMESSMNDATAAEEIIRLNLRFIQFIVSRVELLLRNGIHPVLVFDGAPIPMKRGTEDERRANRLARLTEAVRLLKEAPSSCPVARRAASQLLEKGMDVSTELAHAVIQVLQERRLECIVAPFEADAQLAYLCKEGYVQAAISEDSDLIAYNCPCLIAKLDGYGNCEVLSAQDISRCPSFHGLSYESFLVGCILSGCDYLPSLRHIGVKKAFRLVSQATSVPNLMHTLEIQFGFPKEELKVYESRLQQAFYCFAHHFVFDPLRRKVVHLTPLPSGISSNPKLLGETLATDVANKVCGECLYDPITKMLYKGTYQYCVQQYWRQTKKGQTSLNSFNGFQEIQSPHITLVLGNGTDTVGRRTSPTTTLFTSPLQKIQVATGYCGGSVQTKSIVRSKYFTHNRWKADEWDDSSSSHTSTPTNNGAATSEDTQKELAESDDILNMRQPTRELVATDSSLTPEASSPIIMESSRNEVSSLNALGYHRGAENGEDKIADIVSFQCSLGSAQEIQSQTVSQPKESSIPSPKVIATINCPFGYIQCGRRHSIFEQCFQGKNWTRDVAKEEQQPQVVQHQSDLKNKIGEKRERDLSTTTSSFFCPAYRPIDHSEQSLEGEGKRSGEKDKIERVMLTGRKALSSSTARAMSIMNRLSMNQTLSSQCSDSTGGCSSSLKVALLFEKLEYTRR